LSRGKLVNFQHLKRSCAYHDNQRLPAEKTTAIARARHWLSEIEAGTAIDAIATRESCSKRHVYMTISLGFLAPSLVKAAVDGRLPRGIGVARSMRRSHGRVSIRCWDALTLCVPHRRRNSQGR
jgi:hypothetical protein